jgi:type I restriction-modification system DNA methylase subunit
MDERKAMRELLRILKPSGWASLQVPIDSKREKTFEDPNIVSPQDCLRYFKQEDHVRLYGLDYKDRLEEVGFIVKIEKYARELSPEQIKKYGLRTNESLYFGVKPTPN